MYGDYALKSVRSAAILTDAYVAGTVIGPVTEQTQLIVLADFTKGSLTTAELKVEFSPDNTNWYQESTEAFTGGTGAVSLAVHQLSADGKYRLAIPIKDAYIRISVKGTGTMTDSSMAVKAVVGAD